MINLLRLRDMLHVRVHMHRINNISKTTLAFKYKSYFDIYEEYDGCAFINTTLKYMMKVVLHIMGRMIFSLIAYIMF